MAIYVELGRPHMTGFRALGLSMTLSLLAPMALAASSPPKPQPKPSTQTSSQTVTQLPPAGMPSLSDHPLSDEDRTHFAAAFDAIDRGDWHRAVDQAALVKNPLAAKIINWAYLAADDTKPPFEDLVKFTTENPDWPLQETLLAKAEKALPQDMPAARLIAWFAGQEPLTGEGMIRLGEAYLATGQTNYGVGWITRAWSTQVFDFVQEKDLFAKYGKYVKGAPTVARLNLLLWERETGQAAWLLPQVPEDVRKIAQARIALIDDSSNARALADDLPAKAQQDPGVQFDYVRYLRRRGDDPGARAKLLTVQNVDTLPHKDKWWVERQVAARKAIEDKAYQAAYDIASNSGLKEGNDFADAEWLSGWLALRFLNKPQAALSHFTTLDANVTFPISSARAEYWLGRAAQALGDSAGAAAAYGKAAQFPFTYYGQLSAESPLLSNQALSLPATPAVDQAKWDEFLDNELVKAILLIKQVDEDRFVRTLSYQIADKAPDSESLNMLSQFLWSLDQPAISMRIAKKASQKRILLTDYLYPVYAVPNFPGTGTPPEPALVLGLARQESEFNPRAVSAAGARGLMQILPSTAKITAQKHGLPFFRDRLLTDPAYNMQLGMAHIADLLERYDGSYVLVVAAYNAGANRIDEWIQTYGDPRAKTADPIDWVEMIPFTETRNYVQRVLENALVYRSRIAGAPIPYTLSEELHRTTATPLDLSYMSKGKKKTSRPPPISVVEPAAGAKADTAVKPEATPADDGANSANGTTVPQAAAVPQKKLDAAPGSAGSLPNGAVTGDEDAPPPPEGSSTPSSCKAFEVRPDGSTVCTDQ